MIANFKLDLSKCKQDEDFTCTFEQESINEASMLEDLPSMQTNIDHMPIDVDRDSYRNNLLAQPKTVRDPTPVP